MNSAPGPGVYIHVPFCAGKCPYCDFYSLHADEDTVSLYARAVCGCIGASDFDGARADTVYFGGGTPPLLGASNIGKILEALSEKIAPDRPEITVEVNPRSGGKAFFGEITARGVNRVSIGLQSASRGELVFLGRRHTAADAAGTAEQARRAEISNLSFDLMIGLPGQTAGSIGGSVRFCAENGASHLSVYMLKIEPGTPFYARRASLSLPGDDETADLYLAACEEAEQRGFMQYEISNFAKPGYECRHNLKYWRSQDYLGFGPAAHSCFNGRRFHYVPDLRAFLRKPEKIDDGPAGGFAEYAMLRLRLTEGLDLAFCAQEFGVSMDELMKKARPFERGGLLEIRGDRVALTRRGFLVSNAVIGELVF